MIRYLIGKLERFSPLSSEEANAFQNLPIKLREYARGELIAAQGSIQEESAIVMSGFTCRFKDLPDGGRQIVAIQVPGDFVDLHSFVLKPMDHAVGAASTTHIGRIPHKAIEDLLEKHPRMARTLMWDIAVDGAISREWLAIMGRRSAYKQLAHLFCELYLRMEWAGQIKECGFEFALTQEILADACGLSTVHLNRSLQALRKDGLVVLESHRLTVPDIDALVAEAEFDPAYLHLLHNYAPPR
jgi:CRP-like cAMP-binding protein